MDPPQPVYKKGDFNTAKEYILKHILLEEKAVSMNVLQEIYGVGMEEKRYQGKLKKGIEDQFSDQLIFITAKINNPEVVIGNQVFQDTIHHPVNKNTTVEKAAFLIRENIGTNARLIQIKQVGLQSQWITRSCCSRFSEVVFPNPSSNWKAWCGN